MNTTLVIDTNTNTHKIGNSCFRNIPLQRMLIDREECDPMLPNV
jgi:hypothetical protein